MCVSKSDLVSWSWHSLNYYTGITGGYYDRNSA